MKIMHVILSRGFAGSERSTAESCNEQCKNHHVTLVVSRRHRRRGASIVDHIDPRIQIIEISSQFFVRKNLTRIIGEVKPDLIHCHLRRSTRVVANIRPSAATTSTLHIGVNSPDFLQMDGLVCNARWQVKGIPPNYKGKIFKANNSLTPYRRLNAEEIFTIRKELGVNPGTFVIGAVGRYHRSKAWDTLIEAFKTTKSNAVQLLFFGSGSQEKKLKGLAANDSRIRFIGYRADIKEIYQALDLLAVPSRFEPLPRVILEGMDAGTPVLASDTGGCKELIDDYGGFIFPTDDVAALTKALISCIDSPPERHYPDLTRHHLANANKDLENFYKLLIESK